MASAECARPCEFLHVGHDLRKTGTVGWFAVALADGAGATRNSGGAAMTGRYKVYLPLDSAHRAFDACWHRFVAVCSSLDRDGLSYDVTFNFAPTAEQCSNAVPGPYALITGQGTPKPRVQRRTRASIMPPVPSAEQIQKRLIAAKRAIIPAASNGASWNGGYQGWRQLRNRQQAIGRIIARIKA
jgi:hypothetical protein